MGITTTKSLARPVEVSGTGIINQTPTKEVSWDSGIINQTTTKSSAIPLGICCNCGKKQTQPATGGFWINGDTKTWACTNCKYNVPIPSYPLACEWCTSSDIEMHQGHTYTCRRCNQLKMGQWKEIYA